MATQGGKVILQLSIPFDEVGNQVIDEKFATIRLRLKKVLKSLREARENTPQLNVLIREIYCCVKIAGTWLQLNKYSKNYWQRHSRYNL